MKEKTLQNRKSIAVSLLILGAFVLLYTISYLLPLTGVYWIETYNDRMNVWIRAIMAIGALVYILMKRRFSKKALFFALSCTGLYLLSLLPYCLYLWWIKVGEMCLVLFLVGYASFLLFEEKLTENETARLSVGGILRAFGIGALIGVPFAVGNVLFFVISDGGAGISLQWGALVEALEPAVCEELLYRMFLFGLCMQFTGGKVVSKLQGICVCTVMVLPWAYLHYVDGIRYDFAYSVIMILVIGIIFGVPYYFMLHKKNIYTCIGFHWVTDFLRFFLGY